MLDLEEAEVLDGDGVYAFRTFMPAGIPSGNLTLEVVAFDKSENVSARFPYFTVR